MDDLGDQYRDMWEARESEVGDGWGNYWPITCPQCGQPAMVVMQAGRAVCENCGYVAQGQGARKEL